MEEPENLTMRVLERWSYRDLQRYAKARKLPSNVKKGLLIEMIHASKYSTPEHFESVVARVRDQRKQASKHRKAAKKKRRVQANEISSTSHPSPPISTTPQPPYTPYSEVSHTIIQCQTSILNPLHTKQALKTDRVLRSYNNKVKRNMRYTFTDINNTVTGVVETHDNVKTSVEERIFEWNTEALKYRPVRPVQKREQREHQCLDGHEVELPQPLPTAASSNKQAVDDSQNKQLVPVGNVKAGPRSQRQVSGIYPLKLEEQVRGKSQYFTYRTHEGRICKLNSFIEQESTKTTQRNVKPIVVSRKDTIQMPAKTTIQDVVNYKVDQNFRSSSTETAEDSSSDRIYPRLEQAKNIPGSARRNVSDVKRKSGPKCYYTRILQNRLMGKKDNLEKTKKTKVNVEKVHELQNEDHTDFSLQSQRYEHTYSAEMRLIIQNLMSNNKSALTVKNKNGQQICTSDVKQTKQNYHGSFIAETSMPYGVGNQNNPTNHNVHTRNNQNNNVSYSKDNKNNCKTHINRTRTNCTKISTRDAYSNTDETKPDTAKFNRNQQNLTQNESEENRECYIETRKDQKDISINDAPNWSNTITNIERDYPNIAGLSDVVPESEVSVTQGVNVTSGGEMEEIYYHKKIRAEEVRANRLSRCLDREAAPLPRITTVFQLPPHAHRDLTRPLYVDTGNTVEPASPLESVYNYRLPLAAPLSELGTTTDTNTVYCTPLIVSAVAHSAAVYAEYMPLPWPNEQHARTERPSEQYARLEKPFVEYSRVHIPIEHPEAERPNEYPRVVTEEVPRLQDYIRAAEQPDITCHEEVQRSPVSPWSARSTEMEDALDLISQDGVRGAEQPDITCHEEVQRSPVSPWSACSTEMEDALDLISQDGDYMEQINMDVRARCFLCAWAGPRTIVEYHVRMNHPSEILVSDAAAWCHSVTLGTARDGVKFLTEHAGQIYVASVRCWTYRSLHADLTMLPKDNKPEHPVHGRLTVYNKVSGEPFSWEGEIANLPLTEYENNPDQLASELIKPYQIGSSLINPDQTESEYNTDQNEQNLMRRQLRSSMQSSTSHTSDMNTDKTIDRNKSNRSKKFMPDQLETVDDDFGQNILNLDDPNVLHLGQICDGLNINLTKLDLLPNSANLVLVNGEWVVKSAAKVVAGQPALDDVEVEIYVHIL